MTLFFLPIWYRKKTDPVLSVYQASLKMLEQTGYQRKPGQGPADFANFIEQSAPSTVAAPFKQLSHFFIAHRYKPPGNLTAHTKSRMKQQLRKLKAALKQL